jgi:hypothetical protein
MISSPRREGELDGPREAERLERFRARMESVRGEVHLVGTDWPEHMLEGRSHSDVGGGSRVQRDDVEGTPSSRLNWGPTMGSRAGLPYSFSPICR